MSMISKSFHSLGCQTPAKVFIYKIKPFSNILLWLDFRKAFCESHYVKCYSILGVPNLSDQETVRKAFLELVKKYHPDSGSQEANKEKFHEIESAYRTLQEKFSSERWRKNNELGEYGLYYKENKDVKEFDIKHTAPQHRQYLNYDGYGSGTPQQREKQYQRKKAQNAIENVYHHRLSKIPHGEDVLVIQNKKEAKKIKTRSEMERLVEDLIQESMARGDFENLAGSGKPLKEQVANPYVDFVTHKMNQVLIDNGFAPEWITLQKDIHNEIQSIRDHLASKRMSFGSEPLIHDEQMQWTKEIENLQLRVGHLNKKINTFNLQVPLLNKQMIFFQLEKEATNILKNGKTKYDTPTSCKQQPKVSNKISSNFDIGHLFDFFLFKKS